MSSLKMTFSLASLILILGLVFAPTAVMAHPVTTDNNGNGQIHDGDTVGLAHSHPKITVTIEDADPTSMDTIEVVDTKEDETASPLDFTKAVTPTLQFEVMLTVPVGAEDGGSPVSASTFGTADVPITAYYPDFLPVGAIAFESFAQADATANPREWTATATLSLAKVAFDTDAATTEAAYNAAVAAAITKGIMVDITINANVLQTTGLAGGPLEDQRNLESTTSVTVISSAAGAPAAPAGFVAAAGDAQVMLTWTASTDTTITMYQYSMDGGTTWMDIAGSDSMTAAHTVMGLTNGMAVMFMVRAVNAVGEGAATTSNPVTPMEVVPPAPASITAVAGDGEVTLTWAVVASATSYEYSMDGTFWAAITNSTVSADGTMVSADVTAANGTAVSFQVRGVNSAGFGAASVSSAMVTPMATLTAPGAVAGLMATAGDGQVMLSWTAPTTGGTVASYEYSIGSTWMAITGSSATTTSHTVTGLTNGQTYTFQVRAMNASGSGGASNSIIATPMMPAAPAAPASISATAGDGKVTLTWAAVTGATSYEYSMDAGTTWMAIASPTPNADGTMLSVDVTAANGTAVSLTVRAVGPGGNGAASAAATATPMKPAVTPESAVASLTVPAKSYVIVARTLTPAGLPAAAIPANPATGSSPTIISAWSTMPNLEDLFFRGGSLLLVTDKATKLDRDGKADTATEEAKERDVLVTEIMAARNNAQVGMDGYLTHQWIELYNKLPVPVTVTLSAKAGRPAPAAAGTEVRLDLVSNVVNPGWNFSLGADGTDDGDPDTADLRPFVSFYRNNRGEPGWQESRWTTSTDTYVANHKGTPGAAERSGSVAVGATNPTYSVVINEIGNYENDAYDWIELRHKAGGTWNFKKWQLREIKTDKTGHDKSIVNIPNDDAYKAVPEILLIVATDPYRDPNHPLAAGINITKDNGRLEKTGVTSRYLVWSDFKLSNSGKTLLLLRSRNDGGIHEGIVDLTGTAFIKDQSKDFATDVWPLKGQTSGNDNHGHGDVVKGADEDFRAGHVYQRINAGRGTGKEVWERRGYTGIGYKRGAASTGQNGGTPGYDNGAVKANESELADSAMISISEIMYAKGRNLPQWIELYNSSMTQSVTLAEWKLKIEHSRDADDIDIRTKVTTNNLGGVVIPPNQTILIVGNTTGRTSRGAQGARDFPAARIIDLWKQKDKLEVDSSKNRLNYRFLSETAFKLTLMDKSGAAVDTVGNLGADGSALWELPMAEDGEGRSSIIRRYDDGVPRDGTMVPPGDGTGAWVLAADSALAEVRVNETYYGSPDDAGTPGYRGGGPLPVSLSKFRPERLDDGTIIVRWITESELNNAGFNILRSETRNGDFTKVHFEAGEGTTTERTLYEWKDTSAKPNVVYYYQIQDVSLDGKVQTLRQSRLKGDVSPDGKITTTWGEIKALQ